MPPKSQNMKPDQIEHRRRLQDYRVLARRQLLRIRRALRFFGRALRQTDGIDLPRYRANCSSASPRSSPPAWLPRLRPASASGRGRPLASSAALPSAPRRRRCRPRSGPRAWRLRPSRQRLRRVGPHRRPRYAPHAGCGAGALPASSGVGTGSRSGSRCCTLASDSACSTTTPQALVIKAVGARPRRASVEHHAQRSRIVFLGHVLRDGIVGETGKRAAPAAHNQLHLVGGGKLANALEDLARTDLESASVDLSCS